MTEQEKREYAINIYNAGIALDATDFAFGVDGDSHFDRLAEHLAQLGYRKDEEVRKETAQKIWDELFAGSILMMLARCEYNAEYNEMEDEIRRVFKKFGTKIAKIDQ